MKSEKNNIGKYAVVTGACSGIGYCFACALAASGYSIVAVSNRAAEIQKTADKIHTDYGVEARSLCLDLSCPDAAEKLFAFCKGLEVWVLINNAGVFAFADMGSRSLEYMQLVVGLHVATLTKLTALFAEEMKKRGEGYILNSSSLAGYFAFPGIALYSASKGYVRLFSKSLWYEYRPYGVRITSLCPGAVATDLYGLPAFYQNLGVRLGIICRPEKMVKKALNVLFKGRRVYVPYPWVNLPMKWLVGALPPFLIVWLYKHLKCFQK